MVDNPKPHKRGDVILSSLNITIDGLNLAKEFSSSTPATPVFGTVAVLPTMIRVTFHLFCDRYSRLIRGQDTMINEKDYVELGLSCADICQALERGMGKKKLENLNKSVRDAIHQLTR